jgi:dTDP-4-amino-4,6-dideoxygalactose transaminase
MLSMDVDELERCITPKTKAIMVVHYFGYPCDMDRIMAIAKKYNLYVIEDVSHAQGGMYKGKKLGNFGQISAMSMMSGKAFAAGEMGMLVTDDTKLYERAIAFAHYERNNGNFITESEDLKAYAHIAIGGMKGRVNQVCSALGRGQLKYFDERCVEIRKAMNYFWDLLEGLPGIKGLRVDESTGSNMGGFYCPHGVYDPSALGGLSMHRFCEAVTAETNGLFTSWEGGNYCLHTHNYFKTFDAFHLGTPTRVTFADKAVPNDDERLRPSVEKHCFSVPWFKKFDKEWIERYAKAFRKVVENYKQLLDGDENKEQEGRWHGTFNEKVQQKDEA